MDYKPPWYERHQGKIIVIVLILAALSLIDYATNYTPPPSCDEAPWQEACYNDEGPSGGFFGER